MFGYFRHIYLAKNTRPSKHNCSEVESEHDKAYGVKGRLENFVSSIEISASHRPGQKSLVVAMDSPDRLLSRIHPILS